MTGKGAALVVSLALISTGLLNAQDNGNPLAADRWSGTWQNSELKIELSKQSGQYAGTITFNGDRLPLVGAVKDNALEGTFSLGEHKFTFRAESAGNVLTLVTDGARYVLQKQGTSVGASDGTAVGPSPGTTAQADSIVGDWRWSEGIFHIGADGNATIGGLTYRYVLQNSVLVLNGADGKFEFPYQLNGDSLTLVINGKSTTLSRAAGGPIATPRSAPSPAYGRTGDLTGDWHSPKLAIRIDAGGTAVLGGTPCRYVVRNNVIAFTGTDGSFDVPFELSGDTLMLTIAGQPTKFARGTMPQGQAAGGSTPQELAGKWCYLSNFTANKGGSSASTCVVLNANGTYQYHGESASTNAYGGAAGQTDDSGTWTATENSLSVNSRAYGPITYRMEKRNHPKTRDPMLVLDGKAFVTYGAKAPW